ncbi:MAG: isoprenyl transferase [bacterium]
MAKRSIKSFEENLRANADRLPAHIAFIMDGNGRWAKERGMPRMFGHREGVKSVREMVETGVELGIKVMTFYTFSTENWKRPKSEVSGLMKLLVSTIRKEVDDLDKNNVCLRTIGQLEDLPPGPRAEFKAAKKQLEKNDGLLLVLALSYSGRREITQAVNRLLEQGVKRVDEKVFAAVLDTADLPDPDLLIRTSGEMRLSNFLLWQTAYTELYVTDTYWPDFRRAQLIEAVHDYLHRERRFGRTSEQLVSSNGEAR